MKHATLRNSVEYTLAESAQPIRVVLADDHAIVRNGIAYALCERFPMEIAGEASDGIDLWATLVATAPDLLITDLIMPHFDPLRGSSRFARVSPSGQPASAINRRLRVFPLADREGTRVGTRCRSSLE